MRGTIVLISLLYCISMHPCQVSAGKVTASVRHVNIPPLPPLASPMGMTNGTFIYALCNHTILDNPISTFNCQLAIESAESSSGSCNVTLRNVVFFITRVAILTPDKAILLWRTHKSPEYPYGARVINVLDFKDGCRLHETRLRLPSKNSTLTTMNFVPIVPYDDGTFDVFYENRDICGAGRLCKVRFNDKAEMIGKEEPWVDIAYGSFIMIYAVWPRSPAYGHLLVDYAPEYSQLSYVDTKGHCTLLRNYTWPENPQQGESRPGHSTNNNLLTLCENIDSCEQLDLANNNTVLIPPHIINPELPITAPSINVPTVAMHSLRGGGFLFLQGTHLNRFDAKGQKAGAVEVEGLNCELGEDTLITNVFEKDDGRYCVSSMCYNGDRLEIRGNVRCGIVCFSDENFS